MSEIPTGGSNLTLKVVSYDKTTGVWETAYVDASGNQVVQGPKSVFFTSNDSKLLLEIIDGM